MLQTLEKSRIGKTIGFGKEGSGTFDRQNFDRREF
jgi:hypothetical protein